MMTVPNRCARPRTRRLPAVTEHLEHLRFNSAVAQLYTLANASVRRKRPILRRAARRWKPWCCVGADDAASGGILLAVPGPQQAGGRNTLAEYDPALTASDSVTIAIQVNGKRRGEITMAKNAESKDVEAAALADEGVKRALEGKAPKKVIVVPNRIVNIVA